jgi:hypothetical protein
MPKKENQSYLHFLLPGMAFYFYGIDFHLFNISLSKKSLVFISEIASSIVFCSGAFRVKNEGDFFVVFGVMKAGMK